MDREQIIEKLRRHESELRESGLMCLLLFGSCARGEATANSDVDLMGDFDRSKVRTLFKEVGIELRLADILGVRVDLSDRSLLKMPVRAQAEVESILVF